MTSTREWQSNHSGGETSGSGDPCAGKRPDERLRDLYREYAGCSGLKLKGKGAMPLPFLVVCVIFMLQI